MKNLSQLLIAAIVISCCCELACTKQENAVRQASENPASLKSLQEGAGAVFTVSPGQDLKDSKAIRDAFAEAILSGPGSTVQLTEGTFYLDERIEIEGFEGTFKGAGKDRTIITTNDPVDFSDVAVGDMECLIKFRHGNISISDMTLKITNPTPCTGLYDNDWWNNILPVFIMITGNSVVDPGAEVQNASSVFNNVRFIGGKGSFYLDKNICYFVVLGWDSFPPSYSLSGNFKFSRCEFINGYNGIFSYFTNGPVIIGGDNSSGNKFDQMGNTIGIYDVNGSYANISFNSFKNTYSSSVILWQGSDMIDASTISKGKFLINNNVIETCQYSPDYEIWTLPIWLVDYGFFAGTYPDPRMDIVVASNKISLGAPSFMGILGECISNSVIANNIISGNSEGGIAAGLYDNAPIGWEISTGLVLKGNNLEGLNAAWAPIVLGPGTSNCFVIGGRNKTNVLDQGTSNTLTGVNPLQGNGPGHDIKNAMMMKNELLNMLRLPK